MFGFGNGDKPPVPPEAPAGSVPVTLGAGDSFIIIKVVKGAPPQVVTSVDLDVSDDINPALVVLLNVCHALVATKLAKPKSRIVQLPPGSRLR